MKLFFDFIRELESQKFHYTLAVNTPEAIMVTIAVPGQRWEIEFSEGGEIECEIFSNSGNVESVELGQLIDNLNAMEPDSVE